MYWLSAGIYRRMSLFDWIMSREQCILFRWICACCGCIFYTKRQATWIKINMFLFMLWSETQYFYSHCKLSTKSETNTKFTTDRSVDEQHVYLEYIFLCVFAMIGESEYHIKYHWQNRSIWCLCCLFSLNYCDQIALQWMLLYSPLKLIFHSSPIHRIIR